MCVPVLQRGQYREACVRIDFVKYDLRKSGLFVLSWARVCGECFFCVVYRWWYVVFYCCVVVVRLPRFMEGKRVTWSTYLLRFLYNSGILSTTISFLTLRLSRDVLCMR